MLLATIALAAGGLVIATHLAGAKTHDAKALEFPSGARWLNVAPPLTTASLRGRVVVLDFWTYCCVNCLHALPRLAALEEAYAGQPVVVVGVHSGKFDEEHNDQKVRDAIARYNVGHPVVMDDDFAIWNEWGVRAWPTILLFDANGRLAHRLSGEPTPGQLETLVGELLAAGRASGALAAEAAPLPPAAAVDTGVLRFPGKVLATDGRLFVADSGHNRVVVAELTGKITETIGGPDPGLVDGDFGAARFREPQGMALAGDTLYVADRGNHAIRAVDLRARQVATVAGTGRKGEGRIRGGVALQTDLRSPWDLAYREGGLDVAMAGSHQIWRLDLPKMEITPLAGSGLEQLIDGGFAESAFAQPSGLWLDGAKLYVADSETSAVREIDLARRRVRTLVGTGLFDFGFRDGQGRAAQLQHPIGIAGRGDMLYVADTFNSAVRTIDLKAGALVGTLHVTGIGGFDEPSGASAHGDTLYVADANNHRIVAIDLNTRVARALTLRLPD